jgi:hypothetical protein
MPATNLFRLNISMDPNNPNTVNRLNDNPDLVDIMISIEDYLDRSDMYAFKNWQDGELVAGPYIKPYWISVTLKWPYKKMPDPSGAARLMQHGTKIGYKLDTENVPQPIKTPSDYEPGTHKPKIKKEKVWLVELLIPRRFVEDIDQKILDLYDDKIDDAETVKDAEAEGSTQEDAAAGGNER